MNYARHRIKKALQEKQKVLASMNGAERTKAEKMLIEQAIKEPAQELVAEEKPKRGRPSLKGE